MKPNLVITMNSTALQMGAASIHIRSTGPIPEPHVLQLIRDHLVGLVGEVPKDIIVEVREFDSPTESQRFYDSIDGERMSGAEIDSIVSELNRSALNGMKATSARPDRGAKYN